MANIPIPQTLGRLAQTCDIYGTTGGNLDGGSLANQLFNTNDLMASSSVDPLAFINSLVTYLATANKLGSVESLEIKQTREIERIFSIGAYSFEPYRLIPKAIKTDLTLRKVMLYTGGDMLESCGFPGYNLYHQQAPFILRQQLIDPIGDKETIEIMYFDCWLKSNPMKFDLSSDTANLITQEVGVTCGRVFVSSASVYNSMSTRKSTRNNVKF